MKIKDLEINSLAFRVKGTNVSLSESYEESKKSQQQEYIRKIENDEKKLEEMGFKNESSGEINPKVKELFKGIFDEK